MSSENPTIDQTDSLFVVDSTPDKNCLNIPSYKRRIDDVVPKEIDISISSDPNDLIQDGFCFNCEGNHSLRDCKISRDYEKINRNRKNLQATMRYHVEDDQRFGHFEAGCISNALRSALGLGPKQIPLHVYKMRVLGYPPGWLEEHKIKHSGLTLFDSQAKTYVSDDDEDGEIVATGQKCKYDIKKLIAYPGFNVNPESGTIDESQAYGVPPLDPMQNKSYMIKRIAEDAIESYKKRKMKIESDVETTKQTNDSEVDMDVANDEHSPTKVDPNCNSTHSTLSSKLSPDDDENLLPPGCENTPSLDYVLDTSSQNSRSSSPSLTELENRKRLLLEELNGVCESSETVSMNSQNSIIEKDDDELCKIVNGHKKVNGSSNSNDIHALSRDIQRIHNEVEKVSNIEEEKNTAVEVNEFNVDIDKSKQNVQELENDSKKIDETISNHSVEIDLQLKEDIKSSEMENKNDLASLNVTPCTESKLDCTIDNKIDESIEENISFNYKQEFTESNSSLNTTPNENVKRTSLNTPVIHYTSYSRIPNAECFSKEIADVINFENLPDALGKYDTMRGVIKKVRCALQDIK